MRWWLRIILTLVLAPILWQIVAGYIASNAGAAPTDIVRGSAPMIGEIYIAYTLPALAALLVLLLPADLGLRRIGLALLTVAVAPLLACMVPLVLSRFGLGQATAGTLGLAATYGIVFGLTIREPRSALGAPPVTSA